MSSTNNIIKKEVTTSEFEKVVVLVAGLKGGSGKTTTMSLIEAWYQLHAGIKPKCFDLDPGGTFRDFTAASSPYFNGKGENLSDPAFSLKEIVNEVVNDYDNKVFLVDFPSSSIDRAKDTFETVNWDDLEMMGIGVVVVGNITADLECENLWNQWQHLLANATHLPLENKMKGDVKPGPIPFIGEFPVVSSKEAVDTITAHRWSYAHIILPYLDSYKNYLQAIEDDSKEIKKRIRTVRKDYTTACSVPVLGYVQATELQEKVSGLFTSFRAQSEVLLPEDGFLYVDANDKECLAPTANNLMYRYSMVFPMDVKRIGEIQPLVLSDDFVEQSGSLTDSILASKEALIV